ncbi:unnamed protein product [Rhizophagus irregularis]|nr:unnamed protein product [Rhizophagus irregularis]CAB5391217.1 unnamed protein product [Rhizophagus irregularis]
MADEETHWEIIFDSQDNESNPNQDNVTKSPTASPSSSSSRSPSTNQRKKLHLDVVSPIVPDMAPQIIIDNIEWNLSVERISHESTVFTSVISRPSVSKFLFHSNLVNPFVIIFIKRFLHLN